MSSSRRQDSSRGAFLAFDPLAFNEPFRQQTLNSEETTYIQSKTETSLADWTSYLTNVGLEGLNLSSFVPTEATAVPGETVPLVGIAVSGGGLR